MRHLISLSFTALLLTGCATAPLQQAVMETPANYSRGVTAEQTAPAQASGAWWLVFSDPVLNDLMARAMSRNNDIKVAYGRLEQARALLGSAKSDLWPQANIGYQVTHGAQPLVTGSTKPDTSHSVGADLSYEVDLFGRLSRATQAASLDAKASEALLHDTQLLIQSRVAQSYFTLRTLDEDRAIVGETLTAYRDSLRVTKARFNEGDVAELDVARLEAEVAANTAQAAALDQTRAEVSHALAVLLGESASRFDLAPTPDTAWNDALPVIPAGIPSDLLQRRPDLIAAGASLQAAQRRVGIAKAAWLPSISLTANGGYASSDLKDLFKDGTGTWSLAGILSQAIFDGGRRKSGIAYAESGLDIAFAHYQQAGLIAFADVEDQLSGLDYLQQQQLAQDQAVEAATRATRMSKSRYDNGAASQLEYLDAQRQLLSIRRQALSVRAARYQVTVGLIRALGGGW
ncbi:MAG: efflux transporter outer membrane subunit [Asticcacaulis sp.]